MITSHLISMANDLGLSGDHFAGKKVVIKPNLVSAMKPDDAATTHPVFLCAVIDMLRSHGADDILIAESPAGVYSEVLLKHSYKATGISQAADECGVRLNTDTASTLVHYRDGKICHAMDIIDPILKADIIVDLCKLKSHSLTEMSCAIKNFFGVIPGTVKFEMHSAYPSQQAFSEMITDLCCYLADTHEILAICDGIVAMEGNGPTGGTPRDFGAILMSQSPFCLDTVAAHIIGFDGKVPILTASQHRGRCPADPAEINVFGINLETFTVEDFKKPDSDSILSRLPNLFGGKLSKFLSPKPVIDKSKCIGCGVCAASCPQHTITVRQNGKKRLAAINHKNCIRCFCCQELCPSHVVRIKKNPFLFILSRK